MELYEVMRTTFAAREFTDDDVSDETLYRVLENARFAPSGGNRQGARVIVIRDLTTRERLAQLALPTVKRYVAQIAHGQAPWNPLEPCVPTQAEIDATEVPPILTDSVINAPVVLLVCLNLAVVAASDQHLSRIGVISGASIYPLVWNILLSARNEGLGGTITTWVAAQESEVRDMLSIPDNYAVCAALPIGVPRKQLTRLRRKEVASFVTLEQFDGAPFGAEKNSSS
ncbi:MAG: nitroreductase family protein [Pseudomonadota bacterium]